MISPSRRCLSQALIVALLATLGFPFYLGPSRAERAEDLLKEGLAFYWDGNWPEAIRTLTAAAKALTDKDQKAQAYEYLAYTYIATEETEKAEAAFRELLKLKPGFALGDVKADIREVFNRVQKKLAEEGRPQTGQVKGKVIEAETGRRLRGATVTLGERFEKTSLAGTFRFRDVPAGEHTLRIEALNYQTQEVSVTVRPGEEADLGEVRLAAGVTAPSGPPTAAPPRKKKGSSTTGILIGVLGAGALVALAGGGGGNGTPSTGSLHGYVYQGSLFVVPRPEEAPWPSSPVAGATVTIADQRTTTNKNGYFYLGGLPEGSQTLRVEATGQSPLSFPVNIIAGVGNEVPPTNVPPHGTLEITSDPWGARILIDGQDTGQETPATLHLKEGTYQIKLTRSGYKDAVRNQTVVANQTETLNLSLEENVPPTVSILSPGDGSVVRGTVTIEVNVSDAGSGVETVILEYSTDGETWLEITRWTNDWQAEPFDWSYDWTPPQGGVYHLRARAFDWAGNEKTSNAVSVTVDNTPLSVQITAPAEGAFVRGTVTVRVDATDAGSGISRVAVYVDDNLDPVGADTTAPYEIAWDTTWESEGPHTLTARAYDQAGNVGEDSREVKVDNTQPQVEILEPQESSPTYRRKGQTVTITWRYTESYPTTAAIQIYSATAIGELAITNLAPGVNVERSDIVTLRDGAAEGLYHLTVSVLDEAGNEERGTEPWAVWVDNAAPDPPTDPSPDPAGWTAVNQFTVSWTNPDDLSGIVKAYYKLDAPPGSNEDYQGQQSGEDLASLIDLQVQGEGEHTLYVWLEDRAGNVDYTHYATATLRYDVSEPDTTITSPEPGSFWNQDVLLSGTSTDNLAGVEWVKLEYSTDGVNWTEITTIANEGAEEPFPWSHPWRPPEQASYFIRAWAKDRATNEGTTPARVENVVYDTSESDTTIITPSPDSFWNREISIGGSSTDNLAGVTRVMLEYSTDGVTWMEIVTLTNDNGEEPFPWGYTWEPPEENVYSFRATAVDRAGNVDSTPAQVDGVVYDVTEPNSTFTSPVPDSFRNQAVVLEGESANNLAGVERVVLEYSTDGNTWTEIVTLTNDNWQEPFPWSYAWEPPQQEIYSIRATAVDRAGNVDSTPARVDNVVYDLDPPQTTLTGPLSDTAWNSPLVITGKCGDNLSGAAAVRLYYSEDGGQTWSDLDTVPNNSDVQPFPFRYDWTPPGKGTYALKAEGDDRVGNAEGKDAADVTDVVYDLTPPEITWTSPAPGSHWKEAVTVAGSASDPLAGVVSVKVSYSTDGMDWTEISSFTNADRAELFDFQTWWTPPAEGGYYLRAEATDRAGNRRTTEQLGDWLRDWLLNGPYDGSLDTNPFGGDEGALAPVEGSIEGGTAWTRYISPEDTVNLDSLYAKDYAIAYAYLYLHSPVEQTVRLTGQVDDDLKVWVNGIEVYTEPEGGSNDFTTPDFPLVQGWNRLLLKVRDGWGGWSFQAGLRDTSGNPVSGLVSLPVMTYDTTAPQGVKILTPTQATPDYVLRGEGLTVNWQYTDPLSPCSAVLEVKQNGAVVGRTELTGLPPGSGVHRTDQVPIEATADRGWYDLSISVTDQATNGPTVATEASAVFVTQGSHHTGPISLNETWTRATQPHYVDADVSVEPGVTLTIEPGVEVRFASGTRLIVKGQLLADGTGGPRIVFTGDPAANPGGGFWKDLYFEATSQGSVLRRCLIRHSGWDRRAVFCTGASLQVEACDFAEQGAECIRIQDGANLQLAQSTLTSSNADPLVIHSGATAQIWDSTVTCSRWDYTAVVLRSSASASLSRCAIVATGGGAARGFWLENHARLTADQLQINASAALASLDPTCTAVVSNVQAPGTGKAVFVRDGTTGGYARWAPWTADSWYELEGNVTVRKGSVLRLESSTDAPLRVRIRGGGIYVDGQLEALGSPTHPILLTPTDSAPAPGQWAGIYLRSGSGPSVLRFCRLEYGGSTAWGPSNRKSTLLAENANASLEYCTITQSAGYGAVVYGGTPALKNLTIADCLSVGIAFEGDAAPTLKNSVLAFNGGYEMDHISSGSPLISYCDTYDTAGPHYRDASGEKDVPPGEGNVSQDPQFVDGGAGDYRLQSDSPCLDAGHPDDRDPGTDSRADMGAYPAAAPSPTGGATLTLTAVPDLIPPDGVSSSAICVRVTDASGGPLPAKTVDFAATAGTLSAGSAETDSEGQAWVTLTSATAAGIATVTATLREESRVSRSRASTVIVTPPRGQIEVEFGGVGTVSADGLLRQWLVCGYWSGDLNAQPVPNESALSPSQGEKLDGREWRSLSTNENNDLPLDVRFGWPDQSLALAHVYLGSPVSQIARLWGYADNSLRVFLNGVQVIDGGGNFSADVFLNAGWNRFLVKSRNEWSNWYFEPHLTDLNGNALSGLRYSLSKPGASPPAAAIAVNSGDHQRSRPGYELPGPLVAQVVDALGMPVSGVDVAFQITSTPPGASGQQLSVASATTDAQGLASASLTLGDLYGTYQVQATASVGSATFSAEAGYEHLLFTDRYWKVATTQQSGWTGVDFDDTAWQQATEHPDVWGGSMGQLVSQGAKPIWVARWQDNQTIYLRRSFETKEAGQLSISIEVDDIYEIYLDGNKIGDESWFDNGWHPTFSAQVAAGKHTVAIKATNTGGAASVAVTVQFVPVTLQWSFATGASIEWSSPVYGDIDGEGNMEVVIGSRDGKVYTLNAEDGSKLWEFATDSGVLSSPALGDVDEDGKLEVVVGSEDHKVYALNGEDGSKLWDFATGDRVHSSPALGDIDVDGKLEVVVGSYDHLVYALNGEDGNKLWEFTTGGVLGYYPPALGDIDGDGKLEVVIGSLDSKLYALNGEDGSKLWDFAAGHYVDSPPALGDIDEDGQLEVVVGSWDQLVYALNGEDGSKLWDFATGNVVQSTPALGDIDGDGKLEVIVGSHDGKVYALNGEDGSKLWEFATGREVVSSPALGDIDGDGKLEVIVGSHDGKVYALNGEDGSKVWEFAIGGSVHSSPALDDIDGDGKLEVVVGSHDSKVYCLDLGPNTYNPNLLPWPMFHHDRHRTGLYSYDPGSRAAKAKPAAWQWTLQARTADGATARAVLGVTRDAAAGRIGSEPLRLRLGGEDATRLLPEGPRLEWHVTVESGGGPETVTLTWPDLSRVPGRYRLTLADLDTGGPRVSLRTRSSYTYRPGPEGGTRHFLIGADATPQPALAITNLTETPGRGGGLVSWCYTLTREAEVTAQVETLGGRRVAALAPLGPPVNGGRAGVNTLTWDGRDEQGRPVPNGVYLLRVVATTEEGESVPAVRTLVIRQ